MTISSAASATQAVMTPMTALCPEADPPRSLVLASIVESVPHPRIRNPQ